jgi:hypothetical protein
MYHYLLTFGLSFIGGLLGGAAYQIIKRDYDIRKWNDQLYEAKKSS